MPLNLCFVIFLIVYQVSNDSVLALGVVVGLSVGSVTTEVRLYLVIISLSTLFICVFCRGLIGK